MAALLATPGGGAEGRSHLLARHRDILADYSAEFRRLSAALGEARDRGQLLAGSGESSSHVSLQVRMSACRWGMGREGGPFNGLQ